MIWMFATVLAALGAIGLIAYCARTIERGGQRMDEEYARKTAAYMVRREARLRDVRARVAEPWSAPAIEKDRGGEDDHARAEHLREAREVEDHQEAKHGDV